MLWFIYEYVLVGVVCNIRKERAFKFALDDTKCQIHKWVDRLVDKTLFSRANSVNQADFFGGGEGRSFIQYIPCSNIFPAMPWKQNITYFLPSYGKIARLTLQPKVTNCRCKILKEYIGLLLKPQRNLPLMRWYRPICKIKARHTSCKSSTKDGKHSYSKQHKII